MNLLQLYNIARSRSYYSRSDDEVYQALSSASKKVYLWTSREFRGYFFKTDTTSLQLVPQQQEYALPADLRILIKLGEQLVNSPPGQPYQWMRPADINSDQFILREFESIVTNMNTPSSEFVYYGPYLKQADALAVPVPGQPSQPGDQVRSILLAPIPIDTRQTKIFYAAQFMEISGPTSYLMMPPESHEAILDLAVAELVAANGDAMMAGSYDSNGNKKFQEDFLPWMRMNQITQNPLTQEPYIGDMN